MLTWIFGDVKENICHLSQDDRAAGFLELQRARARWFLSVNYDLIPKHIKEIDKEPIVPLKLKVKR